MALVIVSAGTLASSRLRTVTTRVLVAAAGALAMAGLLGGFALGFRVGGAAALDREGSGAFASLDPEQPGSQALIREIGSLSGRVIQLEAVAGRLTQRVGARPRAVAGAPATPAKVGRGPAGGPLLAPPAGFGPDTGESLQWLSHGLDQIEASLDQVASMVARRDLDQMSFPSRVPIPGVEISSGFGPRIDPITLRPAQHAGIDFRAPYGTSILASAGGRVRRAGAYGAFGKTVEIDHGDGLTTRYGHLSRTLVRVGDIVLPGQAIGAVGSSGRSTGPHLHFEVLRDGRQVRPDLYLASDDS
jgi:murein DD-endopeptidase MepM/ murein hydrolase activator NlpD